VCHDCYRNYDRMMVAAQFFTSSVSVFSRISFDQPSDLLWQKMKACDDVTKISITIENIDINRKLTVPNLLHFYPAALFVILKVFFPLHNIFFRRQILNEFWRQTLDDCSCVGLVSFREWNNLVESWTFGTNEQSVSLSLHICSPSQQKKYLSWFVLLGIIAHVAFWARHWFWKQHNDHSISRIFKRTRTSF
jgi:hypothetical protein